MTTLVDIIACAGGVSVHNPTPMLLSKSDFTGTLAPLTPAQLKAAILRLTGTKTPTIDYRDVLEQRTVRCDV